MAASVRAAGRCNQRPAGIPGIRDSGLDGRLRGLETGGVVEGMVDPGPPDRVSYRLTWRGRALGRVLAAVATWAEGWLTTVEAAVG